MVKQSLLILAAALLFVSCSKSVISADLTDVDVVKKVWSPLGATAFTRDGITVAGTGMAPGLAQMAAPVKPNTIYQIVAKVKYLGEKPDNALIIDLYSPDPVYDNGAQELGISHNVLEAGATYTAKKTFNSGNAPAKTILRAFSFSKSPWCIESIELTER